MLIVSDTTAISTLLKAGLTHVLSDLFEKVLIPNSVADELYAFHKEIPNFIQTTPVARQKHSLPRIDGLGRGETEAIQLAAESDVDLLVIDDRKARAVAIRLGIRCIGLPGVLVLAKKRGLITSVTETIAVLEIKGGLYLSDSVKAEAVRIAGE